MAKLKKVFKTIAYFFLGILVTLCLYTFVTTDIMKKDYANVFGYTYFVVATGSMSGTIEVNDIVIVKLTDDVKLNDIITFKGDNDSFITHRIVQKNGNQFITKGDVNNTEDDAITKEDIVGKVSLIISPSFLLKLAATFIIIAILLALINFDKLFKKYVIEDNKSKNKAQKTVPEDIFKSNTTPQEKSTGNTVNIPIEEVMNIKEEIDKKEQLEEEIEVLETEEVIDIEDNNITTKQTNSRKEKEKELLEQVINLLRIKNNSLETTKINKKWLTRYQYIYKLTNIVQLNDATELKENVNHPPFKEIYDYDLDKAGLYENLRNKIYDMPIYVVLRILTFAVLYNDLEFFDGVYKIMKYKVQIDKDNYFANIPKNDYYGKKQLKQLISFMQKIPNEYDNKNVFELEKIEKLVKLKNYANH